jgi:small-conductance mechanosensitive channel
VERRLASVLQHAGSLPATRVEPSAGGSSRTLTVLGVPIVTITPEDAQDHLSTPDELAAQWARTLDDALARAQQRRQGAWSRFGTEVLASIRAAFGSIAESAITIVPRALASILVLVVFWAIAAAARAVLRAIFRRIIADLTVENLLKQVADYAIWALGLVIAVDALGIDRRSVATGLGLTGIALGFALKDVLSNFVSGLLLLALRPFRVGDQIIVGETEGTVERVVLRATQLRTYDGRVVLVPNAELFTARVTNNTAAPIRRGKFSVHLGYDADVPAAIGAFGDAVATAAGVLSDPAPSVQVRELGPENVVLEVRFWTDSRRDHVETGSQARRVVLSAAKERGIPLPDPDARVVTLRGRPLEP